MDPSLVDTLLAAGGFAAGVAAMALGEQATGLPLFVPSMMSSGIVFFYGAKPPSPDAFLWGTVSSSTLGLGIVTACATLGLPSIVGQGMSAAALLVVYRQAGFAFPPAAALPGILAGVALGPDAASLSAAANMLLFPWLAGHGVMYAVAMATALVRRKLRDTLNTAAFARWSGLSDERLREVFTRFDTSENGSLDSLELLVALRSIGYTVTAEEAEILLKGVDTNGSGEIDFEEFKAICRDAR